MSFFPQLASGVVTQFPFRRTRNWRGIGNILESGEQILLPDVSGGTIAWKLKYSDLSDAEMQSLNALFSASSGSYGSFTFIDPVANLIGWSEDLSKPDWQPGQITVAVGQNDPVAGQNAWAIANPGAATQAISQTLSVPGEYVSCFSVWLRADASVSVTLQRDGMQNTVEVSARWKRYYVSGQGTPGSANSTFSLLLPAGRALQAWGLQVETQPYPSTYRRTQQPVGIFEETYFADDTLEIANTAPGLSSCALNLISRI